jgi:hypothetical protein
MDTTVSDKNEISAIAKSIRVNTYQETTEHTSCIHTYTFKPVHEMHICISVQMSAYSKSLVKIL